MRLIAAAFLALFAAPGQAADLPGPLTPWAGKVVYVDFWASWCGPCAESFPWLNQLQAKYPGLTVVGVNLDAEPAAADAFLKKHPAAFAIVRDPQGALPERYRVDGMPSSMILGPDGRVLHQHSGFRKSQIPQYEAAIRAALAGRQENHP